MIHGSLCNRNYITSGGTQNKLKIKSVSKSYYGANTFLHVPFIQLHETLQHIIQVHTFFLHLFVKTPQPNNKTTRKTLKQQSRETIKY